MKFKLSKEDFVKAVSATLNVAERKTTMPILSNILIKAQKDCLYITATDLEVETRLKCKALVEEEGTIAIPARNLYEIIRELPENEVHFKTTENNWSEIRSGKAKFKLMGMSSEEFPKIPDPKKLKTFKLKAETLREMLRLTAFAVSDDEMRYNLNGIYIEQVKEGGGKNKIRMVATDGHRLALIDREVQSAEALDMKKGVILPKKGVAELKRMVEEAQGDIEIGMEENICAVKSSDDMLKMRLIVGEFPDYRQVIPKTQGKRLVVNREQLHHTLRRMAIMSSGKSRCVKFSIDGNKIEFSSNNPELGEATEDISAEYEGDKLDIGFNAKYFIEVLASLNTDKICIELENELSPGVVKMDKDKDYLNVIMPMRT
jgi:DNA polymerase III subunit beta